MPIKTALTSLAISPHGQYIAAGGDNFSEIKIYHIGQQKLVASLGGRKSEDSGSVWSLDYSLDGTVLASGGSNGSLHLWDAALVQNQTPRARRFKAGGSAKPKYLLRTLSTSGKNIIGLRFSTRNLLFALAPFQGV